MIVGVVGDVFVVANFVNVEVVLVVGVVDVVVEAYAGLLRN